MQKEEEVTVQTVAFVSPLSSRCLTFLLILFVCSSRNYSFPDPPGLFDGHVWPMYLKHKNIMEGSGVDVGKLTFLKVLYFSVFLMFFFIDEVCVRVVTVQLDGTMSKEQLFNSTYGNILNIMQEPL